MGFNFQAGHPTGVFGAEEGQRIARQLSERFGASVPLGSGQETFCLPDELGWSWWSDLQKLARKKLGAKKCPQILAADAWSAVYIDAKVDRELLRPDAPAEKKKPAPRWELATGDPSELPASLRSALDDMVKKLGARSDEEGGLQVGNLPLLFQELTALLQKLGTEPSESAVTKLMKSYSEDDDRIDSDTEIQCLCHAWLTAKHALDHHVPMWLVK